MLFEEVMPRAEWAMLVLALSAFARVKLVVAG